MGKKITTSDFIIKAQAIHGEKYDYTKSVYVNNTTKVLVECNVHGEFLISPANHYMGSGCKKCHFDKKRNTLEMFIAESNLVHDFKYDYSKTIYINANTPISIICKEHGVFEQIPYDHLNKKRNCPACSGNKKITSDEFIKKSNKLHQNKYDYSLITFVNMFTEVCIICPVHGKTYQQPRNHIRSTGCTKCSYEELVSRQVKDIRNILTESSISFNMEHTFDDCRNKKVLPYDFFVDDLNLCIEYDGRQHYEPIEHWGGKKGLDYIQRNDSIKSTYCKDKNIKLLRIKYDEDHIETLKRYFHETFGINLKD